MHALLVYAPCTRLPGRGVGAYPRVCIAVCPCLLNAYLGLRGKLSDLGDKIVGVWLVGFLVLAQMTDLLYGNNVPL